MKSDIIHIDNQGVGFEEALTETTRVAEFAELDEMEMIRLRICAEEMLSLARSVTGELKADFWLEAKGKSFDLHMTTQTVMDKEKRAQLISSASSRKNEAANSFLGKLRDKFEEAMTAESDRDGSDLPSNVMMDVSGYQFENGEWDRYEQSILKKLADNIKIAIRGGNVDMTVTKRF